ncbi:uncharacterized protein [Aegilops tauschii subsp. strangulata]|uniref:uncharacterized protein n=1 Tax=Aegilops tauschii subsp. strangulata TaxID=200361 RepID=UPI003CC84B55
MRPLKWSQYAITFDSKDHLKCSATADAVPMLCTPTISNVAITKTLIDGGAGLNVISIATFEMLQVPYDQLMSTRPFSGVTGGSTIPLGNCTLGNYHTELIDFDLSHIGLSYNAILGYPALANGIITVVCDEKDAVCPLEHAYQAGATENSDGEGVAAPPEDAPAKKKQLLPKDLPKAKKQMAGGDIQGPAPAASDLASVPRKVLGHHLEAFLGAHPFKQGAQRQVPGKQEFITQEIRKLREARAIRGACHPARPADSVTVPDVGCKVHVCVDVASLNKASSQDLFWPSHVGRSRGLTTNYTHMPFGLESAGTTFQRLAPLAMAPRETPKASGALRSLRGEPSRALRQAPRRFHNIVLSGDFLD